MFHTILFDLDGTLFDAEEGIVSSVRRAMDEMGLEVPPDADLREVVGPPLADSFRDLLGVPEARVPEAMERYRRDFSARGMYLYSVYPNIRSILKMLREAGVHVGLATSKPLWLARDILAYFALEGDFDRVVGEEDAAAKLGKPELIRRALPDIGKHELKDALDRLTQDGKIMKNKKNRFAVASHYGLSLIHI